MAATFDNNNDQNMMNLNPEQQLAATKEDHRHKEEMARIEATNRQEDRKIDLDERRVACQEKETDSRLKADEAESETANSIRMAGFTALTETLKWVRETVFPTVMKEKTLRSLYSQATTAGRAGISTRIDWNSGIIEVCPTPKIGVGCFFNDPHDVEVKPTANKQ